MDLLHWQFSCSFSFFLGGVELWDFGNMDGMSKHAVEHAAQ